MALFPSVKVLDSTFFDRPAENVAFALIGGRQQA